MTTQYEIISHYGKKMIYTSLNAVLEVINNPEELKKIIVIMINKNGESKTWFYKSLARDWYLESEEKLCSMSDEYKQIYSENMEDKHVWVYRDLPANNLNEIEFKLHITRDLDIHQYRVKFESLSIQKVATHQEFLDMLSGNIN